MANSSQVTESNFNRKLTTAVTSFSNFGDTINACLLFALNFYLSSGTSNTVHLGSIYTKLESNPRTKRYCKHAQTFIEAHANVKLTTVEIKKGPNKGKMQSVFKRIAKDKLATVETPAMHWMDWEKAQRGSKTLFDAVKRLDSNIESLEKRISDNAKTLANKREAVIVLNAMRDARRTVEAALAPETPELEVVNS